MRRARYAVAGLVVVAAGGIAVSGAAISLGTAVPLVAQHAAFAVAIADVTGDGHGDLIVPGYYSSKVSVHPGNGDGTFGTPFDLATSAEKFTSRIRTAWLNGDAAQDIVINHNGTAKMDVFLSDGAGGFVRETYDAEGAPAYGSRHLALADWDQDGDLDLVSADMNGGAIRVRRNLGGGTFSTAEDDVTLVIVDDTRNGNPYCCVPADLDGDGDLDLATTSGPFVYLHWRQPDGTLHVDTTLLRTGPAGSGDLNGRMFLATDVDGDGLPDLVGVTQGYSTVDVLVFRHLTPTTFAAPVKYAVAESGVNEWDLAAGDLNGDGRPEIVTPGNLLVNVGDGTFAAPVPFATGAGVAVGNVDADAHPDIAVVGLAQGATVFPVQTSGPAPSPVAAILSPGFLSIGASSDVVIIGSAFQAGVTADFGAGVTLNSLTRDTSSKLRANVTVSSGAAPGGRTLRITNPDTGTSTFTYQVLVGGAATVTSLVPAEAHEGDTLEISVAGADFVAGATADLGSGVTVTSIDGLTADGFRMTVNVSLAAPLGTRNLTLRNGSGATTVLQDAFKVLPRRSLDVVAESGRLTTSVRTGRGKFTVQGSLAFNSLSPDGIFDPTTETAEFRVGLPSAPFVIAIGPDTGWTIRGKRASWRSPRRSSPSVTVQLDFAKQTFRIDVTKATLLPQSTRDVLVEATLGDETGTSVRRWTLLRGSDGKVLILK